MTDVRKFWLSFVLICLASMVMHVMVFSKRQARFQHHAPAYPDTVATPTDSFKPQGRPVEGKVTAIGVDRFYVKVDDRQEMFLFGELKDRPPIESRVRVEYFQGSPPTALRWEKL